MNKLRRRIKKLFNPYYPYSKSGILLGDHTLEEREAWIQERIKNWSGDRTKRRPYSPGRKNSGKTMSPVRTQRLRAVLKWNRKVRRELK